MTINFNSVQWLRFFWKNQFGEAFKKKPEGPTVHGGLISDGERLELATRLKLLDEWTPVAVVRFRSGDRLEERGDAALTLRDSFNAWTYGKKEK